MVEDADLLVKAGVPEHLLSSSSASDALTEREYSPWQSGNRHQDRDDTLVPFDLAMKD